MTNQPLWQPGPSRIERSNMTSLQQALSSRFNVTLDDYNRLHQWSIENPENFWASVAELHPLQFHKHAREIFTPGKHPVESRWFTGALLNYAENLLKPVLSLDEAIIAHTETGERKSISGKELYRKVARLASFMRASGIEKGDRVAGIVNNSIETVIAMLATTSLGAVWSSCSPDFGEQGIQDRFSQIEPCWLFCSAVYSYAGKQHNISGKVQKVMEQIPSIRNCIDLSSESDNIKSLDSVLDEFASEEEIDFEPVPFDHPLFIMYSSGTTGKPKCIIHSTGGTLIQHAKEHRYHADLNPGDRIFYFTTCGWMMWNWLVSALASGAAIILFDGSPFHPQPAILFDIMERESCRVMGVSAKYILSCEKACLEPARTHNLDHLDAILSTGSPLGHQSFSYVYDKIKSDLCLSSISGGTDIISCFLLGNPALPVHAGELQCKGLGMDVKILDQDASPVIGKKGELACMNAFPSMPIGFWDDPGNERYLSAYFEAFGDKWCQSDIAEEVEHPGGTNGFIIHGRSDTVLNPGGVRIGTAEIYRQIDHIPEVVESLVIGQNVDNDVDVVLFVVLQAGLKLDESLAKQIKTTIRKGASPRHVPVRIYQVQDTPKTLSGKIAEKAVMNIFNGYDNTSRDTLANPVSLDEYIALKQTFDSKATQDS